MSEPREDISVRAIRANWPLLVALFLIVAAGVEARMGLAQLQAWRGAVDEMLSVEAIAEYRVQQVNTEWRLRLLEAGACAAVGRR